MADCMMFPYNWKGFLGDYSFLDHREFYTNGARLIPTFRVEQMVEHYFAADNNVGSKWIPVSERLPDSQGTYLCRYGFGQFADYMTTGCIDWIAFDKHPHWQHASTGLFVTHWMPLPEPPKEDCNG